MWRCFLFYFLRHGFGTPKKFHERSVSFLCDCFVIKYLLLSFWLRIVFLMLTFIAFVWWGGGRGQSLEEVQNLILDIFEGKREVYELAGLVSKDSFSIFSSQSFDEEKLWICRAFQRKFPTFEAFYGPFLYRPSKISPKKSNISS